MKNIGRLLDALDEILAPENKIHSTVKQVNRFYDPKSAEHTYTLEYKVKVAPANRPYRASRVGSLLGGILYAGGSAPAGSSISGTGGGEDRTVGLGDTQP